MRLCAQHYIVHDAIVHSIFVHNAIVHSINVHNLGAQLGDHQIS